MDPFTYLPAPLPLVILQEVPDFRTLQLLLKASPDARAVFRAHGLEVIEAVAISTLDLSLQWLLLAVIDIYTGRAARQRPESDRAFISQYLTKKGPSHIWLSYRDDPPSDQVLRHMVSVAANIERLTGAVLSELQDRMTRAVTAAHAADHPDSPPVAPMSRPFSWIEAFRVRRALWELQVILDIRDAPPHLGWSDDFSRLTPSDQPLPFYLGLTRSLPTRHQTVETKPLAWCLHAVGQQLDAAWPPQAAAVQAPLLVPPTNPTTAAALGVILPRLPRCLQRPTTAAETALLAARPLSDARGQLAEQDEAAASRFGPGWHTCSEVRSIWAGVNVRTAFFQILKLGLCVWDRERLVALEMANPGKNILTLSDGSAFVDVERRYSTDELSGIWLRVLNVE